MAIETMAATTEETKATTPTVPEQAPVIHQPGWLLESYEKEAPHIIKYMGSKRNILDFVVQAIDDHYQQGKLCDLFGGTTILSGALGKQIPMHSNDIQEYSSILAHTYLGNYQWEEYGEDILHSIIAAAEVYVEQVKATYPAFTYSYHNDMTMAQFEAIERAQQDLINADFRDLEHHLFIKTFSGTYWSYEQCMWIDAFRHVAEAYIDTPVYYAILASLMFAMSYNSQSTGHFAQYRDAADASSLKDILIYRQREILPYFKNKFEQLQDHLGANTGDHLITTLDYGACLDIIEERSLVYADPPYAFVHYSRFYHALETLVKYDYPEVQFKGRYRGDRHQSPFCRRTEVNEAFTLMFTKIKGKEANLILSYSNTGMITLEEILSLARKALGGTYTVTVREEDHMHSTMGRKDDKNKAVQEYLIIAKRNN